MNPDLDFDPPMPARFSMLLDLKLAPQPAASYTNAAIGKLAIAGLCNIVDGWASITPLGRAVLAASPWGEVEVSE